MALQEMFPAVANSPATELSAAITDIQTTITLLDASKLPDAPNIATIGVDETAETVRYEGKSGNTLTGVTRGFSGTVAKAWATGVGVARYFTAYDADALRENVVGHSAQLVETLRNVNSRGINIVDLGCIGDGETDNSSAFLAAANLGITLFIPEGEFLINTNQKIPLPKLRGITAGKSRIIFNHKDGGFIKYNYGAYNTYGGFSEIENVYISGNHVCDYLITCGWCSEGHCTSAAFGQAVEAAFKVDHIFELVNFTNCAIQDCNNFISVSSSADSFNSINSLNVTGGNFYLIHDAVIKTNKGGNLRIFGGTWLEKVASIIKKTGSAPFNISVTHTNTVKTYYAGTNLFEISCKGEDVITFENNSGYFGVVNTEAILHIKKSGDNVADIKTVHFKGNRLSCGAEVNLGMIAKYEDGVTAPVNIRVRLGDNDISPGFSWYSDIGSKIQSGIARSGIDSPRTLGNVMYGPLKLHTSDLESQIAYDPVLKQTYASDAAGVNKYHYLISRSVSTANRATGVQAGYMEFDNTIGNPIWWNGSTWIRGVRWVSVPTSASAGGLVGDMAAGGGYLYVCVATNTWMRASIATW